VRKHSNVASARRSIRTLDARPKQNEPRAIE
jgi:hypothetical protein